MNIHWEALLAVFAVSFGAAVAVVALVGLALLGLSVRTRPTGPRGVPAATDDRSPARSQHRQTPTTVSRTVVLRTPAGPGPFDGGGH